ncbi:hypothetical protein [Edaphobacter sp. HDX4]|uniref:hypothetical protein n=1 Tax=Edaphobacter sp. HDX4 TaxID=2794064 RepID=UPI002FE616B8
MWLATMLAPLLIGGGVGVPLWQKFFGGDSARSQQINSKADDLTKTAVDRERVEMQAQTKAQIDQIKTEAEAKRNADLEQAQTDSKAQLDAVRDSMSKEEQQNKLAVAKAISAANAAEAEAKRARDDFNKASVANTKLVMQNADLNARIDSTSRESRSLHDQVGRLSVPRGYVVWRGTGNAEVHITSADHTGIEGAFPNGSCFVEDVFGEHIDRKDAKGRKCSDFTFKPTKKSPTAAYILWRTTP